MSTTYGILYKNGINYSHDTAESISYDNSTLQQSLDESVPRLVPGYTSSGYFLRGDATWQTPDNTTYDIGNGGLVRKLDSNTSHYFRGDSTWAVPTNTTYGVVSTAANGLAPASGTNAKYLRGDGTWQTTAAFNTTYGIGNGGLVRKLNSYTTRYFRGDGTWDVPTNTTYGVVSTAANGLVVKLPNSSVKYFRGDGTWQTPPDSNTKVAQTATDGNQNNFALLASDILGNDDTSTDAAFKLDAYYGANTGDLIFFNSQLSGATKVRIRFDQAYFEDGNLCINSVTNQQLVLAATNEANYKVFLGVRDNNHTWCPDTNNALILGTSSYRWKAIYAVNGTIQTSDKNQKDDIKPLNGYDVKQFIMDLKPVSYKFKNTNDLDKHDRTHYGLIAQDVEETMNKMGMTALDFGGFCKDQKMGEIKDDDAEPVKNPDGTFVMGSDGLPYKPMKQIKLDGQYTYALRYEEFIAPMIKTIQLQEEEIQSRKLKIQELKSRLDKLENK